MSEEYHIATVADFLALAPEQRARCAVDLVAWAAFVDTAMASCPGIFETPDRLVWRDDDRIGEISAVVLRDREPGQELSRTEFPAATGEAQA